MKEGGLIRIVAQTFIVYLERKMRRQIAKAYQLREDFLKQKETTHRIFTPVSLIGGYMELLLKADNLNDGQRDDQSGSKRYDKQNLRLEEDGGGDYKDIAIEFKRRIIN